MNDDFDRMLKDPVGRTLLALDFSDKQVVIDLLGESFSYEISGYDIETIDFPDEDFEDKIIKKITLNNDWSHLLQSYQYWLTFQLEDESCIVVQWYNIPEGNAFKIQSGQRAKNV